MDRSEAVRLQALKQLNLLDTPPSESFDRITRMASQLFDLPIAAVSLTDSARQWFKSRVGVDHCEIPRVLAPCAEVTDTGSLLVIPDLLADACYRESLLARSGIRFYAGAPLMTRDGFCLGAMCVLGPEPRTATDGEKRALNDLAAMVMAQIELQHAFGRLDPISGLPNRHQFGDDLADKGRDCPDDLQHLVVVDLIDAANLAEMTQAFGASVIDEIVRDVARLLIEEFGRRVSTYSVGVTQFAWLTNTMPVAALEHELAGLCQRIDDYQITQSVRLPLNPVYGVVPVRIGDAADQNLIHHAYNAAQQARQTGCKVGLYSPHLDEQLLRRFRLLADLRHALLAQEELSLVYQPRVDLRTGRCIAVEALLRWQHPVLGAIAPGEFIPLVERTDLSQPLTEWVIEAAIRQVVSWRAFGTDLAVSVNVSPSDLEHTAFADGVISRLATAGIEAAAFEIEITEGALIRNRQQVEDQLQKLRDGGVRVAIDDFGTGYSSLAYLHKLPVDIVKIDQSFIRDLADEKGRVLVQHLVALSRDLGFNVVAEGIEDRESYDLLRSWHCDEAQGYWLSRPLAPVALMAWLSASNPALSY